MTNPEILPTPALVKKPPGQFVLVWLIVSQILAGIVILLTIAFGAYGLLSEGSSWTVTTYLVVSPVLDIVMIVGAWITYRKNRMAFAAILTSLPVLIPLCYWTYFLISVWF